MAVPSSPWRSAPDSPSRQLLWELSRLSIASNKDFHARLDRENEERELVHRKALAEAAAAHERVRESAELVRRELQLQVENELRQREEEQRRQLEKARQDRVERELEAKRRRDEDRARTAELEARRAEEARKAEEEATARAKKAEKDRKDAEEARARQAQKNAEIQRRLADLKSAPSSSPSPATTLTQNAPVVAHKQTIAQVPASAPSAPIAPAQLPNASGLIIEHERYLAIHRDCKVLREFMTQEGKKSPALKNAMGNMRRELRKSVGQLRAGKNANKIPVGAILAL